jgi:excisionase family DNA binding protein
MEQQAVKPVTQEPVLPAPADRAGLIALHDALAKVPSRKRASCKLIGPNGEQYVLPESVFATLVQSVEALERGDAVTIVPIERLLTTQQAANILNISRPYLVKLLDRNEIPFERTGTHRRLKIDDVLAYRAKRRAERLAQLERLTQLSEDDGDYFQGR